MGMATVMTKTTTNPASLMEETAVDLMSIQIIAVNAYVLEREEGEAAIRDGLLMGIVMISTII